MTPHVENSPKPFVPPFITGLFQVFGVFLLIAALIFALSGNIAVAIACFVAAIFYFGFAYVISALAQIVANTAEKTDAIGTATSAATLEELNRAREAIEKIHSDNAERNKALQWIIDNWNSRP
jgi:hypothetical protein